MSPVTPFTTPATELDRIYNLPDTDQVLDLFERFRDRKLDDAGLADYLKSFAPSREIDKVMNLIGGKSGAEEPDLTTRAGQLIWSAGLAHIAQTLPTSAVRTHPVWLALTSDSRLAGSLGTSARYIDLAVSNRTVTMDWGTPGSWFYFRPDINHINIDLFYTLAAGFDDDQAPGLFGVAHATAVMMHEVGHSQLTKRFTDAMIALQKQEQAYLEKAKLNGSLTRDEFKELGKIRKEFELRMMVMNAAEDNCVNQYAAMQGNQFPHDFGQSLNIANVLLQGSGQLLRKGSKPQVTNDPIEAAQAALGQLYGALGNAFHTTNNLFDTYDLDTWRRLGIDPDAIQSTGAKLAKGETDFEHLMDMAVGPSGLSHLQPTVRDRWLLQTLFNSSVKNYANRRCRIIDDIWDQYAKIHAQVIIDATDAAMDQALDQAAAAQAGQGQPGAEADGAGAGQGAADGDATGGAGTSATDVGDGAAGGSDIQVDGVGSMPGGGQLPGTPSDNAGGGDAADGDADADAAVDAQTIRDLLKALAEMEKAAGIDNGMGADGDNGNLPTPPTNAGLTQNSPGGRSRGVDLTKLSTTSWIDFRKNINELEPVVGRVVDDLKYIRERQRQTVRLLTSTLEILPRGGNVRERLDMRRHTDFVVKRMTGQKITEDDLRRWKREDTQTEATTAELWVLGDGSGSMNMGLPGGGRRIDSAVQSMAILYEAGKRANFDTYVGMWGDDKIRVVADPQSNEKQVGEAFEKIRNGINSGTQLTPSFSQAVDLSAKGGRDQSGRARNFAGMTHFLIISDGELNAGDIEPATQMLLDLFRYGPDVSVDIAILGASGDEMKQVVAGVRAENPRALIDIVESSDASEIPLLLAGRIKKRFEQAAGSMRRAVPDQNKREAFKRAHRSFALH